MLAAHQAHDRAQASPGPYGISDDASHGPGRPAEPDPVPGDGSMPTLRSAGDPQPACTSSAFAVVQGVSPPRPVAYPLVGMVKQGAGTLKAVRYCC